MLVRVLTIAMNTYREAVRARILHGLFALALATSLYAVVVANMSLHQEARVIADIGAGSMSLYAVLVAIVIAATSLHRELELKTIFPILSRPLRRHEYLVGKYLGTLYTLAVFVAVDTAVVLLILAVQTGDTPGRVGWAVSSLALVLVLALIRLKRTRAFVLGPWSFGLLLVAFVLAAPAGAERQLVAASALLTIFEVAIVAAVATFFASFSSPFLTTLFTIGIFVVGRSADTLAHLPKKVLGNEIVAGGAAIARVAPNLHVYVPPRPLLLGDVPGMPIAKYLLASGTQSICYAAALLALGALIFKKRDFQ